MNDAGCMRTLAHQFTTMFESILLAIIV